MATDFVQKPKTRNLHTIIGLSQRFVHYRFNIFNIHSIQHVWTGWVQSPKSNRSQEDPLSFYYNCNIQIWEEMSQFKHFVWHLTQCSCSPYSVAIKEKSIVQLLSKFLEVSSGWCRKKKMGRWTFWWRSAPGVPEFSTLKKFWQKTLKRWSNVTSVSKKGTHWHV